MKRRVKTALRDHQQRRREAIKQARLDWILRQALRKAVKDSR